MSETPHNILLLRATAYTWYHYSYYCCSFCFPPRYAGGGGGWGAAKGRQAVAGRQTDRRWSGAVLGSSLFLFLQGLCCSFVCMIYMYSHLPHHLFADHYSSMYWQTCRIPSCDWLMGLDVFMLLSDWYTCRYMLLVLLSRWLIAKTPAHGHSAGSNSFGVWQNLRKKHL